MDRLSCLPDDVICHILSFLPTKSSVQTSALSKRWRFIWTHVPFFEFNFNDRDCPLNSEIINKIVLQHNHDIHTFHLRGSFKGSEKEFESWIVNITTRNVRNLVINLGGNQFDLPQCIFTCKTLVDFDVKCCGYTPENSVYFPALKKLQLSCFRSQSHESLAHLLSGCPMLEEFTFNGNVLGHFCVSSSILTRLVLWLKNKNISEFGFKLDTPELRYLRLNCALPDKFSVGALDSLIEAEILLGWDKRHQDNLLYSRNVLALVPKLHNVRLLRLWTDSMAAMIHDSTFFALGIKFHNLIDLDLGLNLGFIKSFLENSNNLRVLKLMNHSMVDIDNQCNWVEPKCVPACLISHLQTVDVHFFGCSKHEVDFLGYILKNAKVLKWMELHTTEFYGLDLKKKFEAQKRLAVFGRESQRCELVFD